MLITALALGFLGSVHCLGMCGPIAFMLPLDRESTTNKLLQLGLYHSGRGMAYALLGLLFGFVGKGLYLFGFQQKLSLALGILMIVLVVVPKVFFKKIALGKPIYGLVSKVKSKLGKELGKRTPDTFLTIGFLNGFLPCGLVYMALLGAVATANPWQGALYMLLFGLGTVPLMTSVAYFKGLFKGKTKGVLQKMIPIFVVVIGALFILRGLGLGIPYVSPKAPVTNEVAAADMECH